jgi:hypothetical protein
LKVTRAIGFSKAGLAKHVQQVLVPALFPPGSTPTPHVAGSASVTGSPSRETLDMLLEGPSGCRTITTRATFAMAVGWFSTYCYQPRVICVSRTIYARYKFTSATDFLAVLRCGFKDRTCSKVCLIDHPITLGGTTIRLIESRP